MRDIKELSARYKLTEQGTRKFIKSRLTEINSDGEHVRRVGKSWLFDDVAVERLDKMRGYSEPILEPATVETQSETLTELLEENRRLMKLLIASQNEVIRLQNELISSRQSEPNFAVKLWRKFFGVKETR